jgi:hypothetical protein
MPEGAAGDKEKGLRQNPASRSSPPDRIVQAQ